MVPDRMPPPAHEVVNLAGTTCITSLLIEVVGFQAAFAVVLVFDDDFDDDRR